MEDASDELPVTAPILGEIGLFAHSAVPDGWAVCNGQPLPIQKHEALFKLIGTQFGGNGTSTFSLPDLRGTMVVHGGESHNGKSGGEERHVLDLGEMPAHTHLMQAGEPSKEELSPKGTLLGMSLYGMYGIGVPFLEFNKNVNSQAGNNQSHNNMQPSLALNYCIAIVGFS